MTRDHIQHVLDTIFKKSSTSLIAFDIPGFGQSESRPQLMSPRAMGDFISDSRLGPPEFLTKERVGRFSRPPKEGAEICLLVTTEFAPWSHRNVALKNLPLAPVRMLLARSTCLA